TFQNAVVNPQWAYSWSFGDGTTGGGPNPVHTYSGPGVYHACLTIWTWDPVEQDTCFADHCAWLTIGGDPCDQLEACFQVDPISAMVFQFLNCTSPEVGVQFAWSFGDGSTGTGVSPDHAYQEPGVYTVCLTAYWQNCVDSTCTTLTVGSGTPCDGDFETDFTWTVQGTAVIFQGTSNLPANLLWFFGDGTVGNGAVVTHLYEPPGPYNVCLAAWYWNPQTQDTCWVEHCESVDPFNGPNGIQEDPANNVRIYPQPASDMIIIDGLMGSAMLRLFGADGRLVLQERSSGTTHRLNVADLATGVYVLHLDTDGRSLRYSIAVE
ncbi:MAG TPA: PKD domain-containing protein, partial [Flavobacteriales bacterium]|nr:PKD domain-containing protein [Flavobacteriales bacterium]